VSDLGNCISLTKLSQICFIRIERGASDKFKPMARDIIKLLSLPVFTYLPRSTGRLDAYDIRENTKVLAWSAPYAALVLYRCVECLTSDEELDYELYSKTLEEADEDIVTDVEEFQSRRYKAKEANEREDDSAESTKEDGDKTADEITDTESERDEDSDTESDDALDPTHVSGTHVGNTSPTREVSLSPTERIQQTVQSDEEGDATMRADADEKGQERPGREDTILEDDNRSENQASQSMDRDSIVPGTDTETGDVSSDSDSEKADDQGRDRGPNVAATAIAAEELDDIRQFSMGDINPEDISF
jgi:hypothetical protein